MDEVDKVGDNPLMWGTWLISDPQAFIVAKALKRRSVNSISEPPTGCVPYVHRAALEKRFPKEEQIEAARRCVTGIQLSYPSSVLFLGFYVFFVHIVPMIIDLCGVSTQS